MITPRPKYFHRSVLNDSRYKNVGGILIPEEGDRFCGVWKPEGFRKLPQMRHKIKGIVQCSVVDAKTKRVIKQYPKQKNLILNNGLEIWFGNSSFPRLHSAFLYAEAGTGTTVTQDDSGADTASQTGTTVTITGSTYSFTDTATNSGQYIKWDSGEEARIVTVTNSTTCEVHVSQTVAAGEFTVYRTNQSALTTAVKRTNTYLTGVGNCGRTLTSDVMSMYRTYDFSAEVGVVNYTEIGFGWSVTVGASLWSRILLSAPVAVGIGQQLRVKYTLEVTVAPATTRTIGSSPISGWATASGTDQIEQLGFATIDTNGNGATTFDSLEPGQNCICVGCSSTTAFVALGSFQSRTIAGGGIVGLKATSLSSYTALSFTRNRIATYAASDGNASDWNYVGLNYAGQNNASSLSYGFKFDATQTKDSLHSLSLVFASTVERTLA